MRSDVAKVIVERPRRVERAMAMATAKGRAVGLDELPSPEGMRARHVRNWVGRC
jgi:hypothetical protein